MLSISTSDTSELVSRSTLGLLDELLLEEREDHDEDDHEDLDEEELFDDADEAEAGGELKCSPSYSRGTSSTADENRTLLLLPPEFHLLLRYFHARLPALLTVCYVSVFVFAHQQVAPEQK